MYLLVPYLAEISWKFQYKQNVGVDKLKEKHWNTIYQ